MASAIVSHSEQPRAWRPGASSHRPGGPERAATGLEARGEQPPGVEARGEQPPAWRLGASSARPGGPGRAGHFLFCVPKPSDLSGEFLSCGPSVWSLFLVL